MLVTSKASKRTIANFLYFKIVTDNDTFEDSLLITYIHVLQLKKIKNQNYIEIDLFYPKSLRKHIAMNNNLKCFIVRVFKTMFDLIY